MCVYTLVHILFPRIFSVCSACVYTWLHKCTDLPFECTLPESIEFGIYLWAKNQHRKYANKKQNRKTKILHQITNTKEILIADLRRHCNDVIAAVNLNAFTICSRQISVHCFVSHNPIHKQKKKLATTTSDKLQTNRKNPINKWTRKTKFSHYYIKAYVQIPQACSSGQTFYMNGHISKCTDFVNDVIQVLLFGVPDFM